MNTFVILDKSEDSIVEKRDTFLNNSFSSQNFSIERSINSKFFNDKIFENDDDIFISIDGYVLNKKKILDTNSGDSFFSYLKQSYQKNGTDFIKELRGDFSLTLYDFKLNKLFVSTNITSSKPIYYYDVNGMTLIASNPRLIVDYLKKKNVNYTLNTPGAYNILIFNYMYGERTLINEVKKLLPGHFLVFENHNLQVEKYFNLTNLPDIVGTQSEIIDRLDQLFQEAIHLEYQKDLEYGYKHITTLSGGLDSRMNLMYAHKLGYKKIKALNFGVKNYYDYYIAKRIAKNLKVEFIFNDLKNGDYLRNIDKVNYFLGAIGKYFGPAHSYDTFSKIDWANLGMLHTGQIGDAIVGNTLAGKSKTEKFSYADLTFGSKKLIHKIENSDKQDYPNLEIANIFNRGFNGALDGNIISQEFSEMASPFLYQEFLEYALKIPLELKSQNKLYYSWIDKKLPKAGDYFYEKSKNVTIVKKRKLFPKFKVEMYRIKYAILRRVYFSNSMDPFEKWFSKGDLAKFFNSYFDNHIELIVDTELKKDCIQLYQSGSAKDKLSVISLLNSIKTIFNS